MRVHTDKNRKNLALFEILFNTRNIFNALTYLVHEAEAWNRDE